jgi:cellulose synthase/poly-beta-1,6-N-acetylglucosamine synthase-like glycosyltransferase
LATALEILLGGAAAFLLLPASVLFAEVLLAVTGTGHDTIVRGQRRRLAVLMPAHNESLLVAESLRSIKPQLADNDRLIVVADNCTDDTAAIAASEGAETVIRVNTAQRGKGFALDYGVRHLEGDAPDIVIIIDADCRAAPHAIDRLARACDFSARPVQALYLMHAQRDAGVRMQIAEFAWVVKNLVRPRGLHRLGLPCQLMGSGMAFPWNVIRSANLATGDIVEDLKLGLDLTRAGAAPQFCPDALVTSEFPSSAAGVAGQRTRWEHGHLGVILRETPRLIWRSLTSFEGRILAVALDLMVPPVALLLVLVMTTWVAGCVLFLITRVRLPVTVASLAVGMLFLSVLFSWSRYGRQIVSFRNLTFAMIYALLKIPMYAKFLLTRQTSWVRSKRDSEN